MTPPISIDPTLVERYILALARYGAVGETGVSRLVYTSEWAAAQEQVVGWCREAGLEVRRDAVGNVWGRLAGSEEGPSIVTGSHIDSQHPGGRYDGALGVIGAILALHSLREEFGPPRRTLEVVSFCEEEASRFPSASFWGSRAVTGAIGPDDLRTTLSFDGETIADAMRSVGLDPVRIPEARRTDIERFIELHVEQGPLLEQAGLPVGIVSGLPGIREYTVRIEGRSDHAGAMPMDLRLDPMAAAAEIISRVINTAREMGRPAVTTVGRVVPEPNMPAVVPERVTFTIDARHTGPALLNQLLATHEATIAEVAARWRVTSSWGTTADLPPCPSDPELVRRLEAAAQSQAIPTLTMPSGAIHDTQRMATIAKVAMIFVRSAGGRSHTPAEFSTADDAASGIQVLAAALHDLAY